MSYANTKPKDTGRDWSGIRLTLVTSEIKRRARRSNYLRAELLTEPAWDILLHAYSLELVLRRVSAADVIEHVHAPSTTVVRWMKVLELEGLLTRTIAAADPTQVSIALTQKALLAMDGYFSESP